MAALDRAAKSTEMRDFTSDIFLAFARVHILHHAAEEAVFGAGMAEELARHGYRLSPGTLYPILHGLEKSGLLSLEPQTIDGKVRKYYRITPSGRKVLSQLREKLAELADEVLPGASSSGSSDSSKIANKRAAKSAGR